MMTLIISKMIVHKLNINNLRPVLNDTCIDLSNKDLQEALPFFQKHIINSRKQGAMKRCQFADIEDNSIRKSMTKIIEAQDTDELDGIFIEESRWLTQSQQGSTSDCDNKKGQNRIRFDRQFLLFLKSC